MPDNSHSTLIKVTFSIWRFPVIHSSRPAEFQSRPAVTDQRVFPDSGQEAPTWTKLTAELLAQPRLIEIAIADPRFKWFTQEFRTYLGGHVTSLRRFLELLMNSNHVVEILGSSHVTELLARLVDYVDYLASVTLEEELFSILNVVSERQLMVAIINLFGWSGYPALSVDEVIQLYGVGQDECISAAKFAIEALCTEQIWTPALDRAIQHIADLELGESDSVGLALHLATITEQASFDHNGLRRACEVFGKAVPLPLVAKVEDADSIHARSSPYGIDPGEKFERLWAATLTQGESAPTLLRDRDNRLAPIVDEFADGFVSDDATLMDVSNSFLPQSQSLDQQLCDIQPIVALGRIAAWAWSEHQAINLDQALTCVQTAEDVPAAIEHAWLTLKEIDTRMIGRDFLVEYDPIPILTRIFNLFMKESSTDETETATGCRRSFKVLMERVLYTGRRPPTLQEIGNELGITRERVRQIEAKVREKFLKEATSSSARPLMRAVGLLRKRLGRAFPISELGKYSPIHDGYDSIPLALGVKMEQAMFWLAGPYSESQVGWLVLENVDVAGQTLALLQSITETGPVSEENAINRVTDLGIKPAYCKDWIREFGRFQFRDKALIRWSGSFADKAEQILLLAGEPLTRDEIVARVAEPVSRGPVSSLPADSRFTRVSLTEIGLSAWELEEYTTIEDEIAQEIERQGGQASANHLVTTLAANFGVAEQSVRAYLANSLNFTRSVDGDYLNARRSIDRLCVRPLEKCRRCYLHDGQWVYRYVVTADTLRGSGSGISTPFAAHLGATEPGSSLEYKSDYGSIRIGRTPTGATIGTLRMVVNGLGAEPGDHLFVTRPHDNTLAFTRSPKALHEEAIGLARLAYEMGLPVIPTPSLASIAQAIGLAANASVTEVRRRFRERSEPELAELLTESSGQHEPSRPQSGSEDAVSELLDFISGGR